MSEYSELFNSLGLGALAKEFWAVVKTNPARAEQILIQMQQRLAQTNKLRAAAGTLLKMQNAVQGVLTAVEVAPLAAADAVILSEEATLLMNASRAVAGVGAAGVGAAEVGAAGVGAAEAGALAGGSFFSGPVGWAVIVLTILVVLWLASSAAGAEERPKPPKGNPFKNLPPNPRINPVTRLNNEAHPQYLKYQQQRRKQCRCRPESAPLGGHLVGQHLAMNAMPLNAPCTWPKCLTHQTPTAA